MKDYDGKYTDQVAFIAGKTYEFRKALDHSNGDLTTTNEQKERDHYWNSKDDEFKRHFVKTPFKEVPDGILITL